MTTVSASPPRTRPPRSPEKKSISLDEYKPQVQTALVHAFDVLGDPVRRRILELLADGELSAGDVTAVLREEFGLSQPGVSQHLRVLRENGFARVRPEGARRLYAVEPGRLQDVDQWLERFRHAWDQPLDALATEIARGSRNRRLREPNEAAGRGPVVDPKEEV